LAPEGIAALGFGRRRGLGALVELESVFLTRRQMGCAACN
jgi:hypothetical protein